MGFDKMFVLVKVVGQLKMPEKDSYWLKKYATVYKTSDYGKKGFILENGTFKQFEPIGITWNDSYCRRITNTKPSGCFVKRDLSESADFDKEQNKCTGNDSTNLFGVIGLLQTRFFLAILIGKGLNTLYIET